MTTQRIRLIILTLALFSIAAVMGPAMLHAQSTT